MTITNAATQKIIIREIRRVLQHKYDGIETNTNLNQNETDNNSIYKRKVNIMYTDEEVHICLPEVLVHQHWIQMNLFDAIPKMVCIRIVKQRTKANSNDRINERTKTDCISHLYRSKTPSTATCSENWLLVRRFGSSFCTVRIVRCNFSFFGVLFWFLVHARKIRIHFMYTSVSGFFSRILDWNMRLGSGWL